MSNSKTFLITLPDKKYIQLNLSKEIPINEDDLRILNAYVPYVSFSEKNKDKVFSIYIKKGNKQSIKISDKKIEIEDSEATSVPNYFFHIIYSVARMILLENSVYSVHSICFGIKDDFSLCIAHSGSGKSTLLLDLIERYNFKMFSSNKTFVKFIGDQIFAVSGTKTVTFDKLNKPNIKSFVLKQAQEFTTRISFDIVNTYCTNNEKVKINKIFLISLNPYVKEFEEVHTFEKILALYPFFFDYINIDILVFGAKKVYGVGPKEKNKVSLLKKLRKSVGRIRVYKIKGSLEFISENIKLKYEE